MEEEYNDEISEVQEILESTIYQNIVNENEEEDEGNE